MRKSIKIRTFLWRGLLRKHLVLRETHPDGRVFVASVGSGEGYTTAKEATIAAQRLRQMVRDGATNYEIATAE